MKKMFIARKRIISNNILKLTICIFIVILSFIVTIKYLFKNFTLKNSPQKVNELLALSTNNLIGELTLYDIINFNLKSPENLLKMTFSNASLNKNIKETKPPKEKAENVTGTIKEENKPLIYIYNTHQTEEYNADTLSVYNITPTVYMASNMLKKSLQNYNINSVVEDENIKDVLNRHNWKYNESYYASKLWLEESIKKYPSLNYFIDLHRDSLSLTTTINDKKYAKMMFVVGMNHENYEKNESLALKLNEYLKNNYEGLMRDVFYGKRSEYNQNFHEHTLLVEIGGPENTIAEVNNSVMALADAFAHIIGGI